MSLVMGGEHVHMMMAMLESHSLKIPFSDWFFRCEMKHMCSRDTCWRVGRSAVRFLDLIEYHE